MALLIVEIEFGMEIETNLLQPRNAEPPMDTTDVGILTDVRLSHW